MYITCTCRSSVSTPVSWYTCTLHVHVEAVSVFLLVGIAVSVLLLVGIHVHTFTCTLHIHVEAVSVLLLVGMLVHTCALVFMFLFLF